MSWYEDLTPYAYAKGGAPRTLNVGWLDPAHPFPTGDAPAALLERLGLLAAHARTGLTRGYHYCELCKWEPVKGPLGREIPAPTHALGNGELRACGNDGVRYAAPALVQHYIAAHWYMPPQAFIDAVLRARDLGWEEAREKELCLACGEKLERLGSGDAWWGVAREPIVAVSFWCEGCGAETSRIWPREMADPA